MKLLGEGAMGSVYLAHDVQLDRRVALKIPNLDAAEGSHVLTRFYREARAAAALHHPNLCPVHEVGEVDGVPYLTMAFIEGKPLSEVAVSHQINARQAAVLVRKLALALQEAHQAGIVHRDLKPGNIMIDRRGEPIIMDFGLARRTGSADTRVTQKGASVGTPAYMSPEQVAGKVEAMGPACDIYALGVILYELLAHRLPFPGPDLMTMLSQIMTTTPPPPHRFHQGLDPALEAVCLKAMAKKPKERYESMADLAAALLKYLKGGSGGAPAPVPPRDGAERATLPPTGQAYALAREPGEDPMPEGIHATQMGGLRSVAQMFAHRRRPSGARPARRDDPAPPPARLPVRDPTDDEEEEVKSGGISFTVWAALLVAAVALPVGGWAITQLFRGGGTSAGKPSTGTAVASKDQDLGPNAGNIPTAQDDFMNRLTPDETKNGWKLLFDGKSTQGWHGYSRPQVSQRWRAEEGTLILQPGVRRGEADLATDEEFGDFELTFDWKVRQHGRGGIAYRVVEGPPSPANTGPEYQLYGHSGGMAGVRPENLAGACTNLFGPTKDFTFPDWQQWNHSRLIVKGDKVDHWLNDELVVNYVIGGAEWDEKVQGSPFKEFMQFAQAPKGHIVLRDYGEEVVFRSLKIRPIEGGERPRTESGGQLTVPLGKVRTISWPEAQLLTAALTPDGSQLLVGSNQSPYLRLYDVETGNVVRTLSGHSARVNQVAISPDGRLAISASDDRVLRLWDLTNSRSQGVPARHNAPVLCVAFSRDSQQAISGASDQSIRLWNVRAANPRPDFARAGGRINTVAFSPDGRWVLGAAADGQVRVWDRTTHQAVRSFSGGQVAAFSSDGRWVLTGAGGNVQLWDAANGRLQQTFQGRPQVQEVSAVGFSPDNRWVVATDSLGKTLHFWDTTTGRVARPLRTKQPPIRAEFSQDGRYLVCSTGGGEVYIWPLTR
jgi:WD40 repeat protein